MDRYDLIQEFNKTIFEIYSEEKLQCLSGHFKGKPDRYFDITTKCKINFNSNFNYTKIFDDLILCSDEILYFTAQLFLYRPLLLNPKGYFQKENEFSKSCVRFSDIETIENKRYYMLVDIIYEKFYNFWDRIGDLIASFFPESKCFRNEKNIYFANVIDKLYKKQEFENIITSKSFVWLLNFKENEYSELKESRNQIVHQTLTRTKLKYEFLNNHEQIQNWINKRYKLADYFNDQIEYTIIGFEYTLSFLENIGENLFLDID